MTENLQNTSPDRAFSLLRRVSAGLLLAVAAICLLIFGNVCWLGVGMATSNNPGEGIGPGFAFMGILLAAVSSGSAALLSAGGAWLLVRRKPIPRSIRPGSGRPMRSAVVAAAITLGIILLVRFSVFGLALIGSSEFTVWEIAIDILKIATLLGPLIAGVVAYQRERRRPKPPPSHWPRY